MLLRHGFLEECFDYVFNVAEREVMIALAWSNNAPALKLLSHIGFVELCRVRDSVMEGVDTVVLEMRKENCKWLPRTLVLADTA